MLDLEFFSSILSNDKLKVGVRILLETIASFPVLFTFSVNSPGMSVFRL